MADLILIRHATSVRAEVGIWGRLFDAPLREGFEYQLSATKSKVALLSEYGVFSSPLTRCLQTARFVCPGANIEVIEEFRPYYSGIFEEEMEDVVREHYPSYVSLSYRERFISPSYGEESIAAQVDRVGRGLLRLLRSKYSTSIIVAHYSTINIIAHVSALNWDVTSYADGTYDLEEGGYLRVSVDPVAVAAGLG